MMFEIDENNLPVIRTRQALLVLDLQNEFLAAGCQLQVTHPPNLIDNIAKLVSAFREKGTIIWVRSFFEASRPINGLGNDTEKVVTNSELLHRKVETTRKERPSHRLLAKYSKLEEENGVGSTLNSLLAADKEEEEEEEEGDSIEETFLTVGPGQRPRYVLAQSPATNLFPEAVMCFDCDKDIILQKTHYSAFRDGTLVQTLRAKFVTELYICGALTNMGVFATAMDAAQHGYSITIVDDCLGYRSKARHDEALRRVTEFTGCDTISSEEVIQDLQPQPRRVQDSQKRAAPPPPPPSRDRRVRASDLDCLMSKLNLRPDGTAIPREEAISARPTKNVVVGESPGSSESTSTRPSTSNDKESPKPKPSTRFPPVSGNPDRVPSKIKTRRRRTSKPVTTGKDPATANGGPSGEKPVARSTSATLQGASQALKEFNSITPIVDTEPSKTDASSTIPIESITTSTARTTEALPLNDTSEMATKLVKEATLSPELDPISKSEVKSNSYVPEPICEGDTTIIHNLLNQELAKRIFEMIRDEVRWQKMSHQGGDVPRLVAVQGEVSEDGSIPIYRHPADESPPLLPFSQSVSDIRAHVEKQLGHTVNHVLIQFYRDGTDYISEHSDKTLDIVPNTFIANVSLGAQRTMVFRTKKLEKNQNASSSTDLVPSRQAYRAPLPHNSICKMGLVTNMRWLHGIRQDKRMTSEKSEAELAFKGGRISLTFRKIGTFLSKDQQKIWGQGAISKTKEGARIVSNGNTPQSIKMIQAFGKENHSTEFNWAESYGEGFDVLHLSNTPQLFLSGDSVADLRVKMILAENGIEWAEGKLSPSFKWKDGSSNPSASLIPETLPVRFVDNDLSKSTVTGDLAILLYLSTVHSSRKSTSSLPKPTPRIDLARHLTRFQQSNELLRKWQSEPFGIKPFKRELNLWNEFSKEATFIAGEEFGIADFAVWPVLAEICKDWGFGEEVGDGDNTIALKEYCERVKSREGVVKALGSNEAKEDAVEEKRVEDKEDDNNRVEVEEKEETVEDKGKGKEVELEPEPSLMNDADDDDKKLLDGMKQLEV